MRWDNVAEEVTFGFECQILVNYQGSIYIILALYVTSFKMPIPLSKSLFFNISFSLWEVSQ